MFKNDTFSGTCLLLCPKKNASEGIIDVADDRHSLQVQVSEHMEWNTNQGLSQKLEGGRQ